MNNCKITITSFLFLFSVALSAQVTLPRVILTDTCPKPKIISVPKIHGGYNTVATPNGQTQNVELRPPEITSLAVLKNTKGEILKDKNGNPFILGEGGLSNFTGFTTDHGLALDGVSSACMDHFGNLWFGTTGGGVSRYDGRSFTNYTTAQGLGNNGVLSILEDTKGNLWFGTNGGGVARYDGKSFTNYTTSEGLTNNDVRCILEDKNGNLWFGTYGGGVSCYNARAGKAGTARFTNYTTAQGLANNVVFSMAEDKEGNIWFGTYGGGVSCYNAHAGKPGFTNYATAQGMASNTVFSIAVDKAGNIWFGTYGGGVSYYNGRFFTNYTTVQGLASNFVASISEDKRGNLWFGTQGGGVSCYDGSSFRSYTTSQGLANNSVTSMVEDKSGNLWFCTDGGGVSRYNGRSFTNYTPVKGLANTIVLSMLEDKGGNLWFSTDGAGVSCFDGRSFTNYTTAQGLSNNRVFSIAEDKRGDLWFGTDGGGVVRYDRKSFTNYTMAQGLAADIVLSITEDKNGDMWFGTWGGGVSRYNGRSFTNYTTVQGLVHDNIQCMSEDKNGNLWFGTFGGGVSCFDGRSFTNYTTAQGLADNTVFSITEDKTGNLWFGTFGGGVSRYDRQKKIGSTCFTNFTTADGLPDNAVTQIVEYNGILFAGTNLGICELIPSPASEKGWVTGSIYNTATGYPVKDVNVGQNAMYKDSKGIIWIGTGSDKTRLVRFDPGSDHEKVHEPASLPALVIQSVRINDEKICWYNMAECDSTVRSQQEIITYGQMLSSNIRDSLTKKFSGIKFDGISKWYPLPLNLVLPYDRNSITFDFASIETGRNSLVRYKYMLEGYDEDWSPGTDKTSATFGNIDAGEYTFKVKAQSPDDTWSQPVLYTFKVLPPWYKTGWAYGIYAMVIAGALFTVLRWRTASLRKEKEVLEQIVKERTAELVVKKNEAEKLAKVKDEFLSNMSHEIRTPLNAIIGYTDVNLQEELPEKVRGNLRAVKLSSNHLRRIVDDILDYEKIESGKLSFQEEDFNPENVLEEVKQLLYFQAQRKENTIRIELSDSVPSFLYGDREKLMQVLLNLVDNAAKFTKGGVITIHADLVKKEGERVEMEFCVTDTGIGIPGDKLETIFESFTQVDNVVSKKQRGTGLGLTISKRIVELQGGTIKVTSTENKGTRFLFNIPYRLGKKPCTTEVNAFLPKESLSGLRLLVVEDDTFNRDLLGQILKAWKVDVDFEESPEKLIRLLSSNTYHLVLLDIHLPEKDGFEIARMIRTNPDTALKNIPIIALTADVLPGTSRRIIDSGINECVYKPIDLIQLHAKIVSLLNLDRKVIPSPVIQDKWRIPAEYIDPSYLLSNYGSDKANMLQMLHTSADKLNEYADSLRSAYRDKNHKDLFFNAHKLVTVVEILGIKSIRPKLSEIQEHIILQTPGESLISHIEFIDNIRQMASKEVKDLIEHINEN